MNIRQIRALLPEQVYREWVVARRAYRHAHSAWRVAPAGFDNPEAKRQFWIARQRRYLASCAVSAALRDRGGEEWLKY